MSVGNFFCDVFAVFGEGVELGDVDCEVVVGLGKLLECDLVQLYLEDGGLSGEFFCMIVLREGDVYVEVVAGAVSDDLILESGNEGA